MISKTVLSALVGIVLGAMPARAATFAEQGLVPRFVPASDRPPAPRAMSQVRDASFTYMTASEMESEVAALTGFAHPAFERYADVIGRFDPATGRRTNDRPSLVGVLFMKQVAEQVAAYVLEREAFLDDAERLVLDHVDLAASPGDAALDGFIDALHTRWLGAPPGPATVAQLHAAFRQAEAAKGPTGGYAATIALLLQHGALYFY